MRLGEWRPVAMDRARLDRVGIGRIGSDWIETEGIGSDWNESDGIGLGYFGPNLFGLERNDLDSDRLAWTEMG